MTAARMSVTTDVFAEGERIPRRFTGDGSDVSPALHWRGAPDTTRAFALICADPDAPGGAFYHWGLWGLPLFLDGLPEGYGVGSHLGVHAALNDFGARGYRGPCPPHGQGVHRYVFTLYALDTAEMPADDPVTCRKLESLARRHALATGQLTGLYSR